MVKILLVILFYWQFKKLHNIYINLRLIYRHIRCVVVTNIFSDIEWQLWFSGPARYGQN